MPNVPSVNPSNLTSVPIAAAANTANQVLLAAQGAGKQIWVYGLAGGADTGAGSISIQDEDDTALTGVIPVAANGQVCLPLSGDFRMPWFKVPTNKALEIDTVTAGFKGILTYAVVDITAV